MISRTRARSFVVTTAAVCAIGAFLTGLAAPNAPRFELIALGSSGGLDEGDLTAFLLGRRGARRYALLDAGTVRVGLERALEARSLSVAPPVSGSRPERPPTDAQRVWTEQVKAVLITHPHLDHVSGLAINAPDDVNKTLYALAPTIEGLKASVFNWVAWPNFGSEGERPMGRYTYRRLEPAIGHFLGEVGLEVAAYPLSHGGVASTALVLDDGEASVAFFGDTGPDAIEGGGRLGKVWDRLADERRRGRLRGIVIEVSYPDPRRDDELYGHLTPRWLRKELHHLAKRVRPDAPGQALRGLPVVVSHVKPSTVRGEDARAKIRAQLETSNDLGVRFVHLAQGEKLAL